MQNANDELREHSGGSDNLYRYNFGLVITEGIRSLCESFSCWWLLDILASYEPALKNEEFKVWTLTKHGDNSATVKCTDGNDRILKTQNIAWTDFRADTCTIWIELGTALLPVEH